MQLDILRKCILRSPIRVRLPRDKHRAFVEREALREICCEKGWNWTEGGDHLSIQACKSKWISNGETDTESGLPYTRMEYLSALLSAGRIGANPRPSIATRTLERGNPWHFLYYRPSDSFSGVYVDIHHAYASIYQAVESWNVEYSPCRYLAYSDEHSYREEATEYALQERKTRNGLIGLMGRTRAIIYTPNGIRITPSVSRASNHSLALLVLDYLHCAMYDTFRRFRKSIFYANTDGFIIKGLEAFDLQEYLADTWGFATTWKGEGSADISDLGSYRIGTTATLNYQTGRQCQEEKLIQRQGIDKLVPWVYDILRPRLADRIRRISHESIGTHQDGP